MSSFSSDKVILFPLLSTKKETEMREDEYSTNNLQLAAYLYASGLQFLGADKVSGQFIFKFSPKVKAEQLVSSFFTGNATSNPRDLFARLHDLKDLIFHQSK